MALLLVVTAQGGARAAPAEVMDSDGRGWEALGKVGNSSLASSFANALLWPGQWSWQRLLFKLNR